MFSSSLSEVDFLRDEVEAEADLPRPVFDAVPVLLRVFAIDDLLLEVADKPVSSLSLIDSLSSVPEEELLPEVPLVFP